MTLDVSVNSYDIDDPKKIQGRDEVQLSNRSLAALRLRIALDALPDSEGSVLMPGAGAGRYARALARYRPGWSIVAGDLSAVAVSEATAAGGGPSYKVFDAQDPPFSDGTFDAVLFFDLLEHLPDPGRMLKSCHRVLRPGGVLHFFVPLEDQSGTLYKLFSDCRVVPIHRWKLDHVGHIQRFSNVDVLRLTWDAGFTVQDTSYSFHVAGQVHDFVDYWNRERFSRGDGLLPATFAIVVSRLIMIVTWRLAYLEDSLYSGPVFGSSMHVTAIRPPTLQC